MTTYISMLRGINVGGQKKIKMDGLKALYESLSFSNVTTYIQSGNLVFKTNGNPSAQTVKTKIEKTIMNNYGFDVTAIIRTIDELKNIIGQNPFIKEKIIDREKLYVTFLETEFDKNLAEKLKNIEHPAERYEISGKDIFLHFPNGYGRAKLTNNVFESKLKLKATTRNWNTVNQLLEIAKAIQ